MTTRTLQRKKPGKFLAIPQIVPSNPTMDAISENIEQLTGMRGSGGKKAVLWEDMKSLGFAELGKGGVPRSKLPDNSSGGNTSSGKVDKPTQPQNVTGHAGFGMVTLIWDYPTYSGHALTKIYQSTSDNFSLAVEVGSAAGDIFSLPQDSSSPRYYWIRFVNSNGDRGPLNATAGIRLQAEGEDYLKDLIKDQLGDIDDILDTDDFVKVDLLDRLNVLLAEASLENSITIDEQVSEAKVGTATLRATIKNEYYTIVKADEAMAAAVQTVKSEIEDPNGSSLGATIKNSYVSNTTFNQAQAQLKQELQSNIDGVSSTLTNDYYTKVKTDEAIAQSSQTLTSEIEGVKSNLSNNYLTTVKTNEAIATATQTLESEINGVKSSVSTVSKAVADNENGWQAIWGVKATAGDVTASVGLVAKSTGAGHNDSYFYVKNADFKVAYNDGDSSEVVPVFGTMDNPKYGQPNEPRKILVIDTAHIKAASIKDLVVSNLVSDVIIAQSEIRSPVIKTPVINDVNSPFYVSSAGIVSMRGANVNGHINAISGSLNNVVIHEDCTILGTLSAAKIIGDIVKAYDTHIPEQRFPLVPSGSDHLILTLNFSSEPWDRMLSLPPLYTGSQRTAGRVHLNNVYLKSQNWMGNLGDAVGLLGPTLIPLAKNRGHSVKIYLRNLMASSGTPMIRAQDAVYLTYKSG